MSHCCYMTMKPEPQPQLTGIYRPIMEFLTSQKLVKNECITIRALQCAHFTRICEQIFRHANEENKTDAHVRVLLAAHKGEHCARNVHVTCQCTQNDVLKCIKHGPVSTKRAIYTESAWFKCLLLPGAETVCKHVICRMLLHANELANKITEKAAVMQDSANQI